MGSIYSAILLWDDYKLDNFNGSPALSLFYAITMCFFVTEVVFGIFIFIIPDFISVIDVDLLAVSVFWTTVKVFRSLKGHIVQRFMEINLFTEGDLIHVDNICRLLLSFNDEEEANTHTKFLIISIVREHNNHCKEKKCPCWSMVIKKEDDEDEDGAEDRNTFSKSLEKGEVTEVAEGGMTYDQDLPTKIKSQKLREMLEQRKKNE